MCALLLLFMGYMGFHYAEFKGMDCTCFPMLKRSVGPGFFFGDAALLLMALAAGVLAASPYSARTAGLVFASVCVLAAAKQMSGYRWNEVKLVFIPTRVPRFAGQFLSDTGMTGKVVVTGDLQKLTAVFKFGDPPYGVALDQGRQKQAFPQFDETEPRAGLKALGYIE